MSVGSEKKIKIEKKGNVIIDCLDTPILQILALKCSNELRIRPTHDRV